MAKTKVNFISSMRKKSRGGQCRARMVAAIRSRRLLFSATHNFHFSGHFMIHVDDGVAEVIQGRRGHPLFFKSLFRNAIQYLLGQNLVTCHT